LEDGIKLASLSAFAAGCALSLTASPIDIIKTRVMT